MAAFGPADQAEAYARLHGTVLQAQRRTVAATGQSFIVARVRTVGFDVDLCLPAAGVELPQPGNIVGGQVFLVASIPGLVSAAAGGAAVAGRGFRGGAGEGRRHGSIGHARVGGSEATPVPKPT